MAGERLEGVMDQFRQRYRKGNRTEKSRILDEFCSLTGYHRKYAISLLNDVNDERGAQPRRQRSFRYPEAMIRILSAIWKAAGYPWSVRLKAMLPLWLPYARKRYPELTPAMEEGLLSISPRQMDRRLQKHRRQLKTSRYGRTKPGTLLKHQIPIQTSNWDVTEPGHAEIDLVAHCGENASGEFVYSLNLTDIRTGWVETRSVPGRGRDGIIQAIQEMRESLPFELKGIDSDNGSEFINWQLWRLCREEAIWFTRGRPGRKNDNAYVEQKNWTHVRKIFGWVRYDSPEAVRAINDLYRNELNWMMNLFQPSVRLKTKHRIGSRLHREYEAPQTPFMRLVDIYQSSGRPLPERLRELDALARSSDPFELADTIDRKLARIEQLQHRPRSSTGVRYGSTSQAKIVPDAPRGVWKTTKDQPHDQSLR